MSMARKIQRKAERKADWRIQAGLASNEQRDGLERKLGRRIARKTRRGNR